MLEAIVKNCGAPVQSQVATKEFMSEYVRFLKGAVPAVRDRCLDILQAWVAAFKLEPKYQPVVDAASLLRAEGFAFNPAGPAAGAVFLAEAAPDWAEGNNCSACSAAFNPVTRRQHHCRNCGQVFCQACSAKTAPLPQFGIEKEVRVCDHCYLKLRAGAAPQGPPRDLAEEARLPFARSPVSLIPARTQGHPAGAAAAAAARPGDNAQQKELEQREREELELALALSLSEAESKKQPATRKAAITYAAAAPRSSGLYAMHAADAAHAAADAASLPLSLPPPVVALAPAVDPMARYLEQSMRPGPAAPTHSQQQPPHSYLVASAPPPSQPPSPHPTNVRPALPTVAAITAPAAPVPPAEPTAVTEVRATLELLEQKLERLRLRGTSVASDPGLPGLIRALTLQQPALLALADVAEREAEVASADLALYQQTKESVAGVIGFVVELIA